MASGLSDWDSIEEEIMIVAEEVRKRELIVL
jgi:hypothetical protein